MDIRTLFRDSIYQTEKIDEAKGRNRAKIRKAKKKADEKPDETSANKATGVQSGKNPIGKYGKTEIESKKDKEKRKRGKSAQKQKQDLKKHLGESVAMEEDLAADDLINELVTEFEDDTRIEFNEETISLLKDAFMTGYLASDAKHNGSNAKAVYKNSALQPEGEVWNKQLKEKFRRFVYNEKKKRSE